MAFAPLLLLARGWLEQPEARTSAALEAIVVKGRSIGPCVPEERRGDWERLLGALAESEDFGARTQARIEGLVRACKLFATRKRTPTRGPLPVPAALDAVDRLPGFGPSARAALADHGVRTVADLLWVPPATWDDLRHPVSLGAAVAAARDAHVATAGALRPARVVSIGVVRTCGVVPIRGRSSVRAVIQDLDDDTCVMHAFWFFLAHGVLAAAKPGARVIVAGRIKAEPKKIPRTAHPELFADGPEARIVRARYMRIGPPESTMRKAIHHALDKGLAPDPVPTPIALREKMPEAHGVLAEMHASANQPASDAAKRAFIERLAWTEAFTRVWSRIATEESPADGAPRLPPRPDLVRALENELGFAFTGAQAAAINVVASDLATTRPMRRLLLGDVGTGKTAVALAAAAQCVAAGFQVAILAPTSVLALQYVDAVKPLERALSARSAFVAAGIPAALRRRTNEEIHDGKAQIVIGTHALLGEDLTIPKLGLVIVDEQQRLGVAQRLSLVRKGRRPHLLSLSATPIPRTLALALRGELATSTLHERPAGRPPVTTSLAGARDVESVIARVAAACERGERVFWVVPRIEVDPDDEADDVQATAVERRAVLERALKSHARRVVLLHGEMSAVEKRDAMHAFRSGEAQVLVGTTVVEVGVDVPEATLMVVEDAQRFGLSQLHQLRGRVGRGARPGHCVLVHAEPLEGVAKARLRVLVELSSGFDVARADLGLRGAGDLSGTRQHGCEDELLYLAQGANYPWLSRIEDDARTIRATDPQLALEDHGVLRSMVARFSHAMAIRDEAG